MNKRQRNRILVLIVIVEVIAVVILISRVVQVCCAAQPYIEVPTLVALNATNQVPVDKTETGPIGEGFAPVITQTPLAITVSMSATIEPSPTVTNTPTVLPDSPTPTASITDTPATPTSTASASIELRPTETVVSANVVQNINPSPILSQPVVATTVILLPTVSVPTAIPSITIAPTKAQPTKPPSTATPTPTNTPAPTVTNVPSETTAPTALQESGQCSWGWATNPLPDVTVAAQAAINNAGLNTATVRAQAYGENCYDSISGRLLYFGAMYTEFYLNVPVSAFSDVDTMGQIVITAYNILTTLNIALPARPGMLDITFTVGSDKKTFRTEFDIVKAAIDAGKTGAALLAVGGIS